VGADIIPLEDEENEKTINTNSPKPNEKDSNNTPLITKNDEKVFPVTGIEASFRSSLINLCNTILGAGMLGMPFAFAMTGIIFGAVLVILGGMAAAFGLYLLSVCASKLESESSFFSVAKVTYPSAAFIIDGAILLKCFGVGVSYLIVIGDLMPDAMSSFFDINSDHLVNQRWFWITLVLGVVISPLCFLKRLDSLKFTSVIALISVGYLFGIVVGFYLDRSFQKVDVSTLPLWRFSVTNFKAIPIFVFGFTCHQNLFSIYNELGRANADKKIHPVIIASVSICFWIYMIIGLLGYLTFGDKVEDNILNSYPKTTAVSVGRVALTILVTFSYPLQCHPARKSIDNIIFGRSPHIKYVKLRYILETACFIGLSFVIAFFFSGLNLVFGLVGATGSTTICYILPGSFYVKMHQDQPWTLKKIFALVLAIGGCILMVTSVTFLLANTFYFDKQNKPPTLPPTAPPSL